MNKNVCKLNPMFYTFNILRSTELLNYQWHWSETLVCSITSIWQVYNRNYKSVNKKYRYFMFPLKKQPRCVGKCSNWYQIHPQDYNLCLCLCKCEGYLELQAQQLSSTKMDWKQNCTNILQAYAARHYCTSIQQQQQKTNKLMM